MLDVVIPVYNGADLIGDTLAALLMQEGGAELRGKIIVVDDFSTDSTSAVVRTFTDPRVQLLELESRGGRGNACNRGAATSNADMLLFLDADCRPLHSDLLQRHAAAIAGGAELSFGRIDGAGSGFWKDLAREIALARETRAASGDYLAMTSCNMAIPRLLFVGSGGFYTGYRHYGFEDRDLLATLRDRQPRVRVDPDAVVLHEMNTSLAALCRKTREAGLKTAPVFRQRHPEDYGRMGFSRLDANTAPVPISLLLYSLLRFKEPLTRWGEHLAGAGWLSGRLKKLLIRLTMALAYTEGTLMEKTLRRADGH